MAKWLVNEEMEGKQVLEMGCGSGYISIIAARKGAKVIASDISPIAVDAAKINTIINKIKNVECYCSDLFSNLEGKFDLILFNAPFFHGEPTSLLDNNWMSKDGEVVSKFFKDAREYINPMGKVVITSSTLVNQDALKILIKESGFNIENVKTKNIIIEKFFLYECRAF
ncbi:MAG: DUF2431 domain-containing protein [Candidatus Nomurabacteria bacterium]|nr:MAG: DUF2431 domain-containing protein [Candidatus Nomurabacteria bacterium]